MSRRLFKIMTSNKKRTIKKKTFSHGNESKSTQKLYAVAVDRFFSNVKNKDEEFRILSPEEEKSVIKKHKNDRAELENILVKHNIFLAISFASKQQYRFNDFDELISLSMFGLREAAKKFDINKGCRFNTFAVWYIRKYILKQFFVKKEYKIQENTSIYLDSNSNITDEDGDADFTFATLNSKIEPSLEERYNIGNAINELESNERDIYIKSVTNKIFDTVSSTSSLTGIDKKIFNLSFLNRETIKEISKELNISKTEVSKSRKKILTFINDNFSKKEIFSKI